MNGIEEALAMVSSPSTAHGIIAGLDRTEVAEEEIKAGQERYPHKKQQIWDSFKLLVPTNELMLQNETIYRSHAREMVDRVGLGMNLDEATDAEVLHVLVRRSLMAPPGHDEGVLFFNLFHRIMGDDFSMKVDQRAPQESYPNAAAEIYSKIRRAARKEKRGER